MELRAHHLFTLSRMHFYKLHKSEFRKNQFQNLKIIQFKLLGRGNSKEFTDHLVNCVMPILNNEVESVKIIATYDAICKNCPQKGNNNCQTLGKEWSQELLSKVDLAVVKNSNDLLEIGKEYPPNYLIENITIIRSALRKTLLQVPFISSNLKKVRK